MKKKKILFLGGSFSQVPAIKYAKQIGLYIITVDYLPQNPGHKYADKYFNISTVEKEQILKLSQKLEIDAISSYASDPAAPTAAYVSEKMDLIGSSYHSVITLSNKSLFRKFLFDNKFNCPWYISDNKIDQLKKKYNGEKAILKPVDSSGSKGIFTINNLCDLESYFQTSKNYSRSGQVILEQYIESKGPQIHGEGFVVNGEVVFLLMGDQVFSTINNLVPYSTIVPSNYHKDIMDKVHELIKSAIKKVGFQTGGINVEVIRDKKDRLYILEIGARNGGNFMPQLMKYATGFDLVKANVDSLLNEKINLKINNNIKHTFYAQIILHSKTDGYFDGINIPFEFKNCLLEKMIYFRKEELINTYRNSKNVVGVIIIEIKNKISYKKMQDALTQNKWVLTK